MAPLPGFSEDADPTEQVHERFRDMCSSLNIDSSTADEAWGNYQLISVNYTLEGDKLHWLCCALYVACRKSTAPTVGEPQTTVEGNCVSLTQLRQKCNISMLDFFDKAHKWADMSNLPESFRKKLSLLERNFQVCSVIFKKYSDIYLQMFSDPANDPPRAVRSRKMRKLPCTSKDVYDFCWAFFVRVKANFPDVREELISCFHLLLACLDYIFANVLLNSRRDILNPKFAGLPADFNSKDWKLQAETVPCVLEILCEKYVIQDAWSLVDVKRVKEHILKPYIRSLFENEKLKGDKETLCGILDVAVFDMNKKAINNDYEDYVHRLGDFDERVFSHPNANSEIGTPVKASNYANVASSYEPLGGGYAVRRNLQSQFDGHLAPATPLTGRNYLKAKEPGLKTPVSTATQSVSRLQALLSGRQTGPSEELLRIFGECQRNPEESIRNRVKEMGNRFCAQYGGEGSQPGLTSDMARKRLQLAESLYYKILENIIRDERKRLKPGTDLSALLHQEMLHQLLFTSCLEIVLFSYNSQRTFPWILEVFPIQPFYFYRIIEVLIRAEDQLSRDVVKHLNHMEETILESMAWRAESPLWECLKNTELPLPSCEEVSLPSQLKPVEKNEEAVTRPLLASQTPYSPLAYSNAKRMALGHESSFASSFLQSPVSSVADRFQSPMPTSATRRRLFSPTPGASAAAAAADTVAVGVEAAQKVAEPPPQTCQNKEENKPKRTGSLGLFFRKFYHLASVRLQDLCTRLELYDEDLRKKIWTCFEYSIMHQTDLMQDRHLDQILMCAIYVICKVVGKDKSFTDIMKCYREQPHASSHVYRSVLLCTKERRGSASSNGGSASGGNHASATPSPAPSDKDEETNKGNGDERKGTEIPPVRSSSTLPFPQPSSCPPTPTRLAGTASSFEYEDRGDLIRFYNTVYVRRVQKFALKFSSQNKVETMPLSPLPLQRSVTSPRRKVTVNYPIYISPLKTNINIHSAQISRYSFNRSPSKDLQAINALLSVEGTKRLGGKRLVSFEIGGGHLTNSHDGPPPPKFPLTVDTAVARRISFQ